MRELREAIATAKHNRKGKPHRQSTVIDEWLNDLRTEIEEGWTGYGQTNHLLKTIACYGVVFEGLSGDALIEFVQTTAVNAPGYGQWCRHQQEIRFKAMVWARSASGYYWRLGTQGNRQQSGDSDAGADRFISDPFSQRPAGGGCPAADSNCDESTESRGHFSRYSHS
jgi:hypothetical protein